MNRLVMMANVAMTLPYVFIAIAYFAFRRNTQIEKPFLILKSNTQAMVMAIVTMLFVGFANLFTIFEPLLSALQAKDTQGIATGINYMLLMVSGPVIFALLGYVLYQVSLKRR